MSPSKSCASVGSKYTRKLYFDPRADQPSTGGYRITDEELREKLSHLIDMEEKIENVTYYSHPLFSKQLTNGILYHAFIVIQTLNWWWSIEKNTENITIQRSKKLESVRDMNQRKERKTGLTKWTGIRKNKTTEGGNTTIKDLINYMWRKDVLNKDYHVVSANCQQLAALLFDRIESPQNHLVYFDKAFDQPPSTKRNCFMTAEQVITEVQRLGVPETLKNLELYKLEEWNPWVPRPIFASLSWLRIHLTSGYSVVFIHFVFIGYIIIFLPNTEEKILITLITFCFWFVNSNHFEALIHFLLRCPNVGKNYIYFSPTWMVIFETNEGTYWSFEQFFYVSTHLEREHLVAIHRATNKDILLNKHQQTQRNPLITSEHLFAKADAEQKDMIKVLEFIWKKDYLDSPNDPGNFSLAPATDLAQILYNKFKG